MSSLTFFSLQKKLLVLVLSTTLISISTTTVIFLNFDKISIFQSQLNIIIIGISLMIGLSILTYFLAKRLSEPLAKALVMLPIKFPVVNLMLELILNLVMK